MTYNYYYFESGEVSEERFKLEIELLKILQDASLLENLSWNDYDTYALRIFHQMGIHQASKALFQRHRNNTNQFKQYHFIEQCRNVRLAKKYITKQKLSISFYLGLFAIFSMIGYFLYFQYEQDRNINLQQPLTTKKRHLSLNDNLAIILLTFVITIIICSIILLTRIHRKLIFLELILLSILLICLAMKIFQIITFLLIYRELRWLNIYDYTHS